MGILESLEALVEFPGVPGSLVESLDPWLSLVGEYLRYPCLW
jgi:hypothetical protein